MCVCVSEKNNVPIMSVEDGSTTVLCQKQDQLGNIEMHGCVRCCFSQFLRTSVFSIVSTLCVSVAEKLLEVGLWTDFERIVLSREAGSGSLCVCAERKRSQRSFLVGELTCQKKGFLLLHFREQGPSWPELLFLHCSCFI